LSGDDGGAACFRQRRAALRLQHGHHSVGGNLRLLFVWLTFLGAIVALREHGHLGVDILVRRLPNVGKKICWFSAIF
jgi:hypothetical protein